MCAVRLKLSMWISLLTFGVTVSIKNLHISITHTFIKCIRVSDYQRGEYQHRYK